MNYFTSIFIIEDEGEIIIPRAFFNGNRCVTLENLNVLGERSIEISSAVNH